MKKQKVKKQLCTLKGKKDEGIEPDKDTRAFMNVALDNGYILAEGYDEDTKIVKKTTDHPVKIPVWYDPAIETSQMRLESIAKETLPSLISRRNDVLS